MRRSNNSGDVVVITGASSGIGRATAHEFARDGARIALLARGREGLDAAKREVEQLGAEAIVIPTDVADAEQVEAAAEKVENTLGPIRVWVNNAVVTVLSKVWELKPEELRRVTEVGYLGVAYGTLAALKRMRPRNHGAIIQIGSALSYRGIPLNGAYCAAQHAIKGLCESLWTELEHEHSNVSVTLVMPSGVNTPLWNHCRTRTQHLPRPIGKLYQPEVIARAIHHVAYHPRRKISVGHESVKAVIGNRIVPWLADWDLARTGIERQESEPINVDPNRPDNLWEPSQGDPGVHGPYDDEAWGFSAQAWVTTHRGVLGTIAFGLVATAVGALMMQRADTTRLRRMLPYKQHSRLRAMLLSP